MNLSFFGLVANCSVEQAFLCVIGGTAPDQLPCSQQLTLARSARAGMMPHVPQTKGSSLVRMEIQTVVVGGFQMPSLIVLKTCDDDERQVNLPIRIGPVESLAITVGIEDKPHERPLTHDLMLNLIDSLGARLGSVSIVDVRDTTFFATLQITRPDGSRTDIDCRPSDAIALAVRCGVPIYVREQVLNTATMPDFKQVEKDSAQMELQAFHDFVEGLSPEDFS